MVENTPQNQTGFNVVVHTVSLVSVILKYFMIEIFSKAYRLSRRNALFIYSVHKI